MEDILDRPGVAARRAQIAGGIVVLPTGHAGLILPLYERDHSREGAGFSADKIL